MNTIFDDTAALEASLDELLAEQEDGTDVAWGTCENAPGDAARQRANLGAAATLEGVLEQEMEQRAAGCTFASVLQDQALQAATSMGRPASSDDSTPTMPGALHPFENAHCLRQHQPTSRIKLCLPEHSLHGHARPTGQQCTGTCTARTAPYGM